VRAAPRRQAPGWLMGATAGLRRAPRRGWAWARLGVYAAAVGGVFGWALLSRGAPPWIAVTLAAAPAVILFPMVGLAVECLAAARATPKGDTPRQRSPKR
jgi:hypothetical protein